MPDFSLFTQNLKARLTLPLPGEPAQFKMAPLRRLTIKEYYDAGNKTPKKSAVLICLYPFNDSVNTVLMLRPSEQGVHSDQVSFPGGGFEASDVDLKATALREAQEEIGIETNKVEVIGELTKVYIPVSNSLVQPFLGILTEKPTFKKSDAEVKEIIETDVRIFSDASIKKQGIFPSFNNFKIEAPYYELNGHRIWGATAMMLSELNELLQLVTG